MSISGCAGGSQRRRPLSPGTSRRNALLDEALGRRGPADRGWCPRRSTPAPHTGRSPQDKFIVDDDVTRDRVWWETNAPMEPAAFDRLLEDAIAAVTRKRLHAQTLSRRCRSAPRLEVTVFTETAWHALFIRNLLMPRCRR